ncbi:MAG: long-chain-fatty-acid--CoA ligase [Burkholderiales bacterium]|nr:long-chain-fatty-acid--CoA ligase [Burkholderiales bacterium]
MAEIYQYRNFYSIVASNAQQNPNKTIIYDGDLKITNRQLLAHADNVASYLADYGVKAGDKVALVMSNSWQFVANIFAISKLGAVMVAINNFLKEDEISYILNDAQAKILFSSAKFAKDTREQIIKTDVEKIIWVDGAPIENENNLDYAKLLAKPKNSAKYANRDPEQLALIVYTSGTTGKPKGAMLSYKNIQSNAVACMQHLQVKHGGIKMVCYLPMFHGFTLTVTLILPIITNSGVVIIRSIATKGDFANLLKQVLLKRIPFFVGVPDVYSALSRAKLPWYFHMLHAVKGFISGAAPLAEETMRKFGESFKRGKLLQGYGISECSPVVSTNVPWSNRVGSVGQALPSYQVECFDEQMQLVARDEIGEICVKGDCVMLGYFNRPDDTAEAIVDGWFRTGDIGKVDQDGFIYILDRKKDLIISKGMNIYPREIEEIIYTHDKVNACAVVGVRDLEANETPVAYIELKEDISATEAEIKDFIRPHLAPFKQPRKIIFMEKLPRNATGKILKRELRELANKA